MPYKGSKNAIARDIIDILPAGDVFVDLFAGGCAVTHAAPIFTVKNS
jgi:site-specific DNA-adenine methylase